MVIVKLSVGSCVENKPNWHVLKSGGNINHKGRFVVLWLEPELSVVDICSLLIIAFQRVTVCERGNVRKDSGENSLVCIHSLFGQIDFDDERGSKAIEGFHASSQASRQPFTLKVRKHGMLKGDTRNKQRIEPSPSWPIREESRELLFRTGSLH